ncbi:unnamed protein product [Choristocarpus tenellus]
MSDFHGIGLLVCEHLPFLDVVTDVMLLVTVWPLLEVQPLNEEERSERFGNFVATFGLNPSQDDTKYRILLIGPSPVSHACHESRLCWTYFGMGLLIVGTLLDLTPEMLLVRVVVKTRGLLSTHAGWEKVCDYLVPNSICFNASPWGNSHHFSKRVLW